MRFYSFENSTLFNNSDSGELLNDLFEKTMVDNGSTKEFLYKVPIEFSGRIDLITNYLCGSIDYSEEMMVINNIVNPFSVEKDDILYYTNSDNMTSMYKKDITNDTSNKNNILNINKSKGSTKRLSLLPPSVNPGIKQVDIDYGKKTITVINKFNQ